MGGLVVGWLSKGIGLFFLNIVGSYCFGTFISGLVLMELDPLTIWLGVGWTIAEVLRLGNWKYCLFYVVPSDFLKLNFSIRLSSLSTSSFSEPIERFWSSTVSFSYSTFFPLFIIAYSLVVPKPPAWVVENLLPLSGLWKIIEEAILGFSFGDRKLRVLVVGWWFVGGGDYMILIAGSGSSLTTLPIFESFPIPPKGLL